MPLIVLLAVVLSISGVYTHDIYQTKPVFSGVLNDTTRVTTSVTPHTLATTRASTSPCS